MQSMQNEIYNSTPIRPWDGHGNSQEVVVFSNQIQLDLGGVGPSKSSFQKK